MCGSRRANVSIPARNVAAMRNLDMKAAYRLGAIAGRLDEMGAIAARDLFFALACNIDSAAAHDGFDGHYSRNGES